LKKEPDLAFTLPESPSLKDALEPHVSAETLEYHRGKHHAKYVSKLSDSVEGKPEAETSPSSGGEQHQQRPESGVSQA
jgi:superoxide dismutase